MRASPLGAPPVSLAPSRPRAGVPESENSARDFVPAPRSEDGILEFSMDPVLLLLSVWTMLFIGIPVPTLLLLLLLMDEILTQRLPDRVLMPG